MKLSEKPEVPLNASLCGACASAVHVEPNGEVRPVPLLIIVPLWVLAIANLWFGIDATPLVDLARSAAEAAIVGGVAQ